MEQIFNHMNIQVVHIGLDVASEWTWSHWELLIDCEFVFEEISHIYQKGRLLVYA